MRLPACLIAAVLTVPAYAVDPKDVKTGLIGTFSRTSSVSRLEPIPALSLSADESSNAQWSGFIYIVTPGDYQFSANQFGGELTVKVGENVVYQSANSSKGKSVSLTPGLQPFVATFKKAERNERCRVELLWEGPGFRLEPIPYFFFSHLPAERETAVSASRRFEHGRFLFEESGCKNCHVPESGSTFAERRGPTFVDLGRRVRAGWIDAWLADPKKLRPQTTMPKMFGDDQRGQTERYAVVQYLSSLGGPLTASSRNANPDVVRRGEKLFTLTGCAACHLNKPNDSTKKRTEDDDPLPPYDPTSSFLGLGTATGPQSTYAFSAMGSKTTPNRLAEYLLDPLKTHPHGRMPNMGLNGNEANEIAQFLCKSVDDSLAAVAPAPGKAADLPAAKLIDGFDGMNAEQRWREVGKQLVISKGCANCHDVPEDLKKLPAAKFAALAEARKKPDAGCADPKAKAGASPVYSFDETQTAALKQFLSKSASLASNSHSFDARVALKRFMCLNCHTRDGEGGLAAELSDKMKALETADNADDVRPPTLTSIGHKSTPEWLKDVLLNKGRARPWMGLRMPQFGEANVGLLVNALPQLEGATPTVAPVNATIDSTLVAAGRTLTGKDGYGCIACHDISGVTGGGTRGPDLALTQQRVRPEWFERWMHNPQRLSPGTKMPQYFLDGKATNPLLNADPTKQIDAFRAYFSLGMGLPLPNGLEPPKGLVIAVKDRTQILRTFMPEGAGTRSFAVGYPGNVNLAYDSTTARLAYAWAGNFIDASPVWTNRGGNPAKLLGPKFWNSPEGHPWATTSGQSPPDFAKRAKELAYGATPEENKVFNGTMLLHFDGFALDDKGNPTFKSTVRSTDGASLTVSETPFPITSGVATGFGRRFDAAIPNGQTAWFLAGNSSTAPKQYGADDQPMVIESTKPQTASLEFPLVLPQSGNKAIVLTVPSAPKGTKWMIVPPTSGNWQVMLMVPANAGARAEIVVHTWSVPKDDAKLVKVLK